MTTKKRKQIPAARRTRGKGSRIFRVTRNSAELNAAAAQVIVKRTAIVANAALNPVAADYAELSRMVPEKIAAFSTAGAGAGWEGMRASTRLYTDLAQQWLSFGRAASALVASSSPMAATAIQTKFTMEWWKRMVFQSSAMVTDWYRIYGAAIAPLHRAAVANANRLR